MSRVRLFNPGSRTNSGSSRSELLARIRELQRENETLQDTLDRVANLAAAPEDEREESEDDLVDKLNEILEAVAPDDDEEDQLGNR